MKTLKIGIELEYNLPDSANLCRGDNPDCKCISRYTLPNGERCENTCSLHGKCELEKNSGCPDKDIFCVAFAPLCTICDKADRGCSTCLKMWAPEKEPETVRNNIAKKLAPTKFLGSAGKCGVLDVVRDGSLGGDGGVEIVTVGQRTSFAHMYDMCKNIIDVSKNHGAFVNERTSIHFHILSGYLSTSKYNPKRPHYGLPEEMEQQNQQSATPLSYRKTVSNKKPFEIVDMETHVPEIVLANFHQLWRRFENAFIWLTSTGNDPNRLTRWTKFRRSLLKHSALRHAMPVVFEEIHQHLDHNRRYAMVNYVPIRFSNKTGAIDRLHFEIRVSDGSLNPASVAAQACLVHALLLKAVDLSRHGVMKSGDKDYMGLAQEINGVLCNNSGDWGGPRHSDTSRLDPYIDVLVAQAVEMVTLCKSFLIDDTPAYEILLSLAKQPVSIRRCNGKTWGEIDAELMPSETFATNNDRVMETIDTMSLTECDSSEQWLECLSEDFGLERQTIHKKIHRLMESGHIFWNPAVGSFCRR